MLQPGAHITQAEQDELLALLDTARGHRQALEAAGDALNQFIADRAPDGVGEMLDMFGDGTSKPALECVWPGGHRPAVMSERANEQRFQGYLPGEPVEDASAGVRAQARALHANRQRAQERYAESAAIFNDALNRLMYRLDYATHGLPAVNAGTCIDVFGTGLVRPVTACTWPEPISFFPLRRYE